MQNIFEYYFALHYILLYVKLIINFYLTLPFLLIEIFVSNIDIAMLCWIFNR